MDDRVIIASLSQETGRTKQEIRETLKAYFKALKSYLNSGSPVTIEGFGKISHPRTSAHHTPGKAISKTTLRSGPKAILDPDGSATYAKGKGRNSPDVVHDYYIDMLDDIYLLDTKKILSELIVSMGIEQKFLAEKVFDITPNTLRAYRQEKSKELSPRLKEIALSIQVLYEKGKEIFLTNESFNRWLDQAQIGLEGRKPIDMVNTLAGINMVIEELLRIEHGATA